MDAQIFKKVHMNHLLHTQNHIYHKSDVRLFSGFQDLSISDAFKCC